MHMLGKVVLPTSLTDLVLLISRPELKQLRDALVELAAATQLGWPSRTAAAGVSVDATTAVLDAVMEATTSDGGSFALAAALAGLGPAAAAAPGSGSGAPSSGDHGVCSSGGGSDFSAGRACQVEPTAVAGAAQYSPYKESVQVDDVVKVSLVGMSWIHGLLLGLSIKLWMDDGCNFSNISEENLRENYRHYVKPGSPCRLVRLVVPVRVSLFAGSSKILAHYLLVDVPVTIGRGVYTTHLLVVPQSNYGITLGNDFNWAYGAVRVSRDPRDRSSGRSLILPLNPGLLSPGAVMPQPPSHAGPNWRPKQHIPLHYEVTSEYWKVVDADGLPPKAS